MPEPDDDVLVLNWPDFAELRQRVDDAQMRSIPLFPSHVGSEMDFGHAADRAIAGWLQSRGFNSLSRFYKRMTPIVVDPKAERLTVDRDTQPAMAVQS